MTELFLYDKENGLFKSILNNSTVMNGSYHVSPNQGNDLNTSNLETYIKDPANGLIDLKQYPICVCMTPRSRIALINGNTWEQITFNLFFLTTTKRTGNNQIKNRDKDTNVSAHHIWYDWQDMKTCAMNFCSVLARVIKCNFVVKNGQTIPLRTLINFERGNVIYNRFTKFNNDQLTGVSVAFTITMEATQCEQDEYVSINDIIIPSYNIHSASDDE